MYSPVDRPARRALTTIRDFSASVMSTGTLAVAVAIIPPAGHVLSMHMYSIPLADRLWERHLAAICAERSGSLPTKASGEDTLSAISQIYID